MLLEDHLGDIIRKARIHNNMTLEAAARGAGLTTVELEKLEETGQLSESVDFAKLGALLGLDHIKLQKIARGWQPAAVDTSRWNTLVALCSKSGGLTVNSYVVWDPQSREAALFDVGFDAAPVIAVLQERKLMLKFVFITHTHHDHVAACPELQAKHPGAVRIQSHSCAGSNDSPTAFRLGNLLVTSKPTPGHSEDGMVYIVTGWPNDVPPVAFVGDCLFAGSVGWIRTDPLIALRRIRANVLSLPPSTLICPGHGPLTTVGEELASNPFFPSV